MAHVVIVGLSHHTAPLDVREKIALSPAELPAALARVRAQVGVREAAIVSKLATGFWGSTAALRGLPRRLAAGAKAGGAIAASNSMPKTSASWSAAMVFWPGAPGAPPSPCTLSAAAINSR